MVVRRPGWWATALLLSVTRLDASVVLAQRDAAAHRELLQFESAGAVDVNSVVAGVTTLVNNVVDTVAAGIRLPDSNAPVYTPSSSSSNSAPSPQKDTQTLAYTPAPSLAASAVTPVAYTPAPALSSSQAPAALTDATAATAAYTPAPAESSSAPTSAVATVPPALSAAETSAQPTEAPTAGADETAAPALAPAAAVGGSADSEMPAPSSAVPESAAPTAAVTADSSSESTTDRPIDSPNVGSAGSALADGSDSGDKSPARNQSDVVTNGTVVDAPKLEDNLLPALASVAPTEAPATPSVAPAGTSAAPAVTSVAPSVTPAAGASAAAQVPVPSVAVTTDKSAASLAGAGQVHAPHYNGSMTAAVSGVGKNASDPTAVAATTRRPRRSSKATTNSGSHTDSASSSSSVESSNKSSGGMYSLGTSSILSIVGVIVGIGAIVGLFVVISRKKYGDESDDDELPTAYGYRIDGGSVVRLSPTFLHNGENSIVGGGGGSLADAADCTSSSGESGEEKAPYFGSSYGFDNYLAQSRLAKSGLVGGAFSGASSAGAGVGARRSDNALLASDLKSSIYSSEASDDSESWSSVMASERAVSRCTRDTMLSGLTMADPSESSRRHTRNSRSTYDDALSEVNFDSSNNYRSTRVSSPAVTAVAALGNSKSSHTSSFYRDGSSRYSDFSEDMRSTGAGSSIYSVGSPSPFDV